MVFPWQSDILCWLARVLRTKQNARRRCHLAGAWQGVLN